MNEEEIVDIDQAKMVISLKNDQINSLINKMKMIDKRANIKVAEFNYKLEQERMKITDLEKKIEQLNSTLEQVRNKNSQTDRLHKEQITRLKELLSETIKTERQKEREYKAALHQDTMKLEKQRDSNEGILAELKALKRVLPIKAILAETQKKTLEELPTFLQLLRGLREKEDEVSCLNQNMEQFKSDTIAQMQESFSKLNSYEQVMEELSKRNELLETSMHEKEQQLHQQKLNLQEKSNILEEVEVYTSEKFVELNQEINNLRASVREYEGDETNYVELKREHQENSKLLQQVTKDFELKQDHYLKQIEDLTYTTEQQTEAILHLRQANDKLILQHTEEVEHSSNVIERLRNNLKDKQAMIEMVSNDLKELEQDYEEKKKEANRYVNEINELMKRKRRLEEELVEKEEQFKNAMLNLQEENSYLRRMDLVKESSASSHKDLGSTTLNEQSKSWFQGSGEALQVAGSISHEPKPIGNLLNELGGSQLLSFQNSNLKNLENTNWYQQYEAAIKRHNTFLNQVERKIARKLKSRK